MPGKQVKLNTPSFNNICSCRHTINVHYLIRHRLQHRDNGGQILIRILTTVQVIVVDLGFAGVCTALAWGISKASREDDEPC